MISIKLASSETKNLMYFINILSKYGWFSRRRVIWLLPHPPPTPSRVSKLSLFLSLPVSRRSSLLTGGVGREGEEPNHMTERKLCPL